MKACFCKASVSGLEIRCSFRIVTERSRSKCSMHGIWFEESPGTSLGHKGTGICFCSLIGETVNFLGDLKQPATCVGLPAETPSQADESLEWTSKTGDFGFTKTSEGVGFKVFPAPWPSWAGAPTYGKLSYTMGHIKIYSTCHFFFHGNLIRRAGIQVRGAVAVALREREAKVVHDIFALVERVEGVIVIDIRVTGINKRAHSYAYYR